MTPSDFRQHHFDDDVAPSIYAGEWRIPKGVMVTSHSHKTGHFAILALGRASVRVDGVATGHVAGDIIWIAAGKVHDVTALTDIVWFCIQRTDTTDVPAMDAALIEEAA